jgi:hypothetical protein
MRRTKLNPILWKMGSKKLTDGWTWSWKWFRGRWKGLWRHVVTHTWSQAWRMRLQVKYVGWVMCPYGYITHCGMSGICAHIMVESVSCAPLGKVQEGRCIDVSRHPIRTYTHSILCNTGGYLVYCTCCGPNYPIWYNCDMLDCMLTLRLYHMSKAGGGFRCQQG